MAIVTRRVQRIQSELVSVTCSKCKKLIIPDNTIDWQEWQSISFTGGYGSVFGDGVSVRIDLCQDCLFEMTKDFYEIEEDLDVEGM